MPTAHDRESRSHLTEQVRRVSRTASTQRIMMVPLPRVLTWPVDHTVWRGQESTIHVKQVLIDGSSTKYTHNIFVRMNNMYVHEMIGICSCREISWKLQDPIEHARDHIHMVVGTRDRPEAYHCARARVHFTHVLCVVSRAIDERNRRLFLCMYKRHVPRDY